ncbi:hypothetical protein Patl1_02073 [Pistacia atlantica]|uniref:Uncharacterized protein n=1 Tax=Pistacia atlantica TaxID=434234 RepID=A0ACC1C6S6_9ROSI|nr:hypothetical protein Patl1_02073 [Pistacia atlantica]
MKISLPMAPMRQTSTNSWVISTIKLLPQVSVLVHWDRTPTKHTDLLFVEAMFPLRIVKAALQHQAVRLTVAAQIAKNVSNPVTFNQKTKELLSQLAKEASVKPKMYAEGELELGYNNTMKLYGLAQCTRDLSHSNCKICLDGIIGDLPNCCDGKEGGRIFTGSCTIRYEIYPFVSA